MDEFMDTALEAGGQLVEDYLAEQEADPEMAAALARARAKISSKVAQQSAGGLAALRLNAGLSQQQLAERIGAHQPSVARWERKPEQMTYSTIVLIAGALGVPEQAIFDAQRSRTVVVEAAATLVHHASA
ncbi:helix-turn-helix domain-containing protein [Hydrogenophaga sp.]|uniref:helix-turn-helix domain-containing protein n=1 Tax=Hydrogenophaga sp. TaxID=1904254 RepID=UPI003F70571F